ncbi:translesion error-prone DNA polymerase V autoproteolytic subunit [Pantoea ananatis]|uniref:translesion error-prone DNA polymerase V autoproteolytic subunit n=1 Tax=Pantoea ananas TaxID=553 RepID=UPI0020CA6273|nr:translesion error-prone DNA polymerase V autoproteolytic subunit [Pantoea ananatis]
MAGFERPEPYEGKLSRTVLRGGWASNGLFLPDELDLNELCITHRAATFFVRASGSSMEDLGLYDGDVMVVDRAKEATHGDIVIAEVGGEFTVKRLQLQPRIALRPMNPAYPVIYPEELHLLGVVTWFFHNTEARRRMR